MLIKALCDYADKREKGRKEKEIPEGWGEQAVHFKINLSLDGEIVSIDDVREEQITKTKGGKEKIDLVPIKVVLPKRNSKSAPKSETIEHRAKYIFGFHISEDGDVELADKFHNAFVKHELDFFSDLDSEICCAYKNFIRQWNPKDEMKNSEWIKVLKSISPEKGPYFRFALTGGRGFLEEDEQFIKKYTRSLAVEKSELVSSEDAVLTTCGILGERLPIAKTHDKIEFPGGLSYLVSMKGSAFESYGKTRSYNSNISVQAMKTYTSTLNWLLADRQHRVDIGGMVIVFFAMKADDEKECDPILGFLSDSPNPTETEQFMKGMFEKAQGGATGDMGDGPDKDVIVYIAGLTPSNRSRICQKFLYRNTFGAIMEHLAQHQKDLQIDSDRQIYFSQIRKELISPKSSKDKVPPPLMASILLAALNGTNYPNALLETVVRRVKTDSDEGKRYDIKLNDRRAGIIKACINRKLRRAGKKEEITMSLNLENTDPAYLCGRLFAVYEKVQKDSVEKSGGKLNRTIKDSYFASACVRPSAIMPKLSHLAQNHLRKLSEGSVVYYNNLIGEIMNGLEGAFPQTLDLDSQGKFIVGYYQQNKALYTSRKQNDEKGES